jgi:eukaryotic-like serine/threonine-protein kinase
MNQPLGTVRPDEFRRIREVFESAAELPPADRARFVETACGGDSQLMLHVQRMLKADEMSHPLLDGEGSGPQGLSEGQCYANRFEITGVLGRGGMGEVYLGRDTNLNRDLAIKTLPRIAPARSRASGALPARSAGSGSVQPSEHRRDL